MTQDIKQHIVDEASRIVTGARRSAYGTPENNFVRICTMWEAYFKIKGWQLADIYKTADTLTGYADAPLAPLDVAAMMRLMKEARLAETPTHLDSYTDIVGYALCGAEVAGIQIPDDRNDPVWTDEQLLNKLRPLQLKIEAQARMLEALSEGRTYEEITALVLGQHQQQHQSMQSSHASSDLTAASSQDVLADQTIPAP